MSSDVELRRLAYLLAATELRGVDGDEKGLDAALLRMLHKLLGNLAFLVDISTYVVKQQRGAKLHEHSQLEELHLARFRVIHDFVKGT